MGKSLEFSAKIAASLIDCYVHIEYMQWDNFNEPKTLQTSVESFKQRFGYYPAAVLRINFTETGKIAGIAKNA